MDLPVKITPDRLKDSIVQIFFATEIPFDALVGIVYSNLEKRGWKYTNRAPSQEPPKGIVIDINPQPLYFFTKESVRIQLFQNSSLAFNCINGYIGWSAYSAQIQEIMSVLSAEVGMKMFPRVGIRYISEFRGIDILDKLKMTLNINSIAGELKTSTFRFIVQEGMVVKNIQVTNKLPVNKRTKDSFEVVLISLLDIDVVEKGLKITDLNQLYQKIESLHTIEKQTFFSLLSDEFLQSLNPEYS
jgi:uncharacterized protein (TIGR04255 family)